MYLAQYNVIPTWTCFWNWMSIRCIDTIIIVWRFDIHVFIYVPMLSPCVNVNMEYRAIL